MHQSICTDRRTHRLLPVADVRLLTTLPFLDMVRRFRAYPESAVAGVARRWPVQQTAYRSEIIAAVWGILEMFVWPQEFTQDSHELQVTLRHLAIAPATPSTRFRPGPKGWAMWGGTV